MNAASELLKTACERIKDLSEPAYVKDSGLVYVAVNDAYARLFGLLPQDLVGRQSQSLNGDAEHQERKDKECRALVFGAEEVALSFDRAGRLRYEIQIERFLSESEHTYLFGLFRSVGQQHGEPAPREGKAAATLSGEEEMIERSSLDGALDMLELGIGIYDRSEILVYCNAQFINYVNAYGIEVSVGMKRGDIILRAYDHYRKTAGAAAKSRDEWVACSRVSFDTPYYENVDQLADGRWMRSVNKRLDNGLMLAIRQDVTEFRDQETLLLNKVSETEVLREVLEDLPVPVFVRDEDHRLSYANAAYEVMLGSGRENFLGKTESEMFPDAAERFRLENDRVLAGEPIDKSEDVTFPDGSVIPVLTRLRRVTTSDGVPHLVGSRTDVSMIREAKDKAEKMHEELKLILDATPVGIAILNQDACFEFANNAFYEFWDADDRFDLVGQSYRAFLAADFDYGNSSIWNTLDAFYEARMDALRNRSSEHPIEVQSTTGRVLAISGTALRDGKMLLTYVDVTAVREHEGQALEAKAALVSHGTMMRDATSAMSQGLLVLRGSDILFANDGLQAMFDMPAERVAIGACWRDFFRYCAARGDLGGPAQAAASLHAWHASITAGEPVFTSFQLADGKWIQMDAKVTDGDHWLAVFTDITETKMREEELTRLLKRAEAADRAKSEFLANMSHEIRTPMNGVLGMAELLAKSSLDGRQKTFIDIIVKSGNALLTIINDILDFSKIDAGQMTLRKAPFDPVEAIEDVATLLSSAAADKDIELIVRGDVSVRETVLGDAGRFRQIVTNLVGNAVKFTEKGHVFIDLKSRAIGDGQMMLSVRIEDTGLGIPKEKLDTVFEKFSQVDTSSTRRHEGTGLGLAITAGLVELFGGNVRVESEPGVGSVFTVELPFAVVSDRKPAETLPVNTTGARVLIVDDNPVNCRILTEQLSMWGFDTVAAESGAIGLAVMEETARLGVDVDAIVLDYHMPEMNGLDFARLLRADNRFDLTGLVFLTSMDMAGDDTLFERLNVQSHLMKPARANLLRQTMIDVVRQMRTRRLAVERQHPAAMPEMSAAPVVSVASAAPAAQASPVAPPVPAAPAHTAAIQPFPARAHASAGAPHATQPAAGTQASIQSLAAQIDILIAEDNEVNQIVFTQILQSTSWHFKIVANGAEAVEAWQKYDPALIIMDVSMPVMNGHQATEKIREIERQSGTHVPIIGVTAHALESDRELCLQVGMDDYLSKPISPEALEEKIRMWIDGAVIATAYQ